MKDHVISGIVIESEKERFDIVIKTGKTTVTDFFTKELKKLFELEFCVLTIKLIE